MSPKPPQRLALALLALSTFLLVGAAAVQVYQSPIVVPTLADMQRLEPHARMGTVRVLGRERPGDWGEPRDFAAVQTNLTVTNIVRQVSERKTNWAFIHKWNGDAKVFGARNDSGVTANNSPMIQEAVEAAAEMGIPLVLEGDGTNYYQIDEAIVLKSNTKIVGRNAWIRKKDGVGAYPGDPYQASIFRNENLNETVDANFDPVTQDHDIELVGLGGFVIDGNGLNSQSQLTNGHPSHALRLIGVNRLKVKDVTIKDAAFFAILIGACRQVEVSGCTVTNAFTARNTDPDQGRNNDGIDFTGCVDCLITDNIVYATDDAIAIVTFASNSRNIVISGNLTHQMIGTNAVWTPRGIAVATGGPTGPRTENVIVSDNVAIVRSGSGIAVFKTTGNTNANPVKNVLVSGNLIIGDGTDRPTTFGNVAGLAVSGVEGVDFVGNVISNFVGRAVSIADSKRLRFIDNRIYTQRRQTFDTTPYGFYFNTFASNLEDIEIRGGVIEDTLSGISVFPTTNYYVTNLVISDVRIANTVSNTTTLSPSLQYGAVHLFNAHRVRVSGLRIEGVPAAGISALIGSDIEIRNNRIRGTDLPIVLSGVSGSRVTDNWMSDQVLEPGISPAGAVYLWQNYGPNTDCEIANNRFEGIPRAGIYVPSGGVGTNLVVRGNTFLRGGTALGSVTNDALADDYAAVSIQGPGGTLVEGNVIRAWDAGGIWLSGATNIVIRDNTLDQIGITTNAHGIYVRAESAQVPSDMVTVQDNRVANVSGYGIGLQSPKRWNVSGNTLFNCSTGNTGSSEIFIDVNGVATVDTAAFSGSASHNVVLAGGSATYGIRGQVRDLPTGVNSGNWNGARWVISGNTVRSSVPYNFTPTLNAVGVVEGTPVWRATIGTTNYTFEGHHKILDYFNAADLTVTLPSAASMANFGEFLLFKAGANTNMVTVTRSGSDTINGQTSISWTNQFRGYKFRSISGAWYAELVQDVDLQGAGGGTGTVTSVGLSLPTSLFQVSSSPVTSAGTLTGTLTNQSANRVFAGPTSGGDATPAFRLLVLDDIPSGVATDAEVNARISDAAYDATAWNGDTNAPTKNAVRDAIEALGGGGGGGTNILVNSNLVANANLVDGPNIKFRVDGSTITPILTNAPGTVTSNVIQRTGMVTFDIADVGMWYEITNVVYEGCVTNLNMVGGYSDATGYFQVLLAARSNATYQVVIELPGNSYPMSGTGGYLGIVVDETRTTTGFEFIAFGTDGVLSCPVGIGGRIFIYETVTVGGSGDGGGGGGANIEDNWYARTDASGTNVVILPQGVVSVTTNAWAPDFSAGRIHEVTMSGNLTLSAPTGVDPDMVGQTFLLVLVQDSTGGRTVTPATNYLFGLEVTGIGVSTNAGSRSYVNVMLRRTNVLDVLGSLTGYQQ